MKKRWATVVLVLTMALIAMAAAAAEDWYTGWRYRQLITINTGKVETGTHANFPLLITQTNISAGLWAHATVDARDILFTSGDGTNKLPHEIEYYDAGSKQLAAWVKLAELSTSSGTNLYIYYGKSTAVDQQDVGNVWSEFGGVWHLNETNTTTAYDSTTNDNDGTRGGSISQKWSGVIADADWFHGNSYSYSGNGRINCGTDDSTAFTNTDADFTISCWYQPHPTNYRPALVVRSDMNPTCCYTNPGKQGYSMSMYNGSSIRVHLIDDADEGGDDSDYIYEAHGITLDMQWHYVLVTVDRDAGAWIYSDGVLVDDNPNTTTAMSIETKTFEIGQGVLEYFTGGIDEVRAGNGVRSAGWVKTEYNNQSDPGTFCSAGSEEEKVPPPDPWYGKWLYRQLIVVDGEKIGTGTHSNFPALITEANIKAGLWDHARADGGDILFTPSDTPAKLSHELELYDPVSSKLAAWVRIPALSQTGGGSLYMYYGSPAADQQDVGNVWSDFGGVWHLNETNTTTAYDSTTNDNDGTRGGTITQKWTGVIADADWFYGNSYSYSGDGRIDCGTGASIAFANADEDFSISCWYQPHPTNYRPGIVQRGTLNPTCCYGSKSGYTISMYNGTSLRFIVVGDEDTIESDTHVRTAMGISCDNQWHYVVATVDRDGGGWAYFDGVQVGGVDTDITTTMNITADRFYIGWFLDYFTGGIDEVRAGNGVRSAGWVWTEYNNQSDPGTFYAVGDEERINPGSLVIIR